MDGGNVKIKQNMLVCGSGLVRWRRGRGRAPGVKMV